MRVINFQQHPTKNHTRFHNYKNHYDSNSIVRIVKILIIVQESPRFLAYTLNPHDSTKGLDTNRHHTGIAPGDRTFPKTHAKLTQLKCQVSRGTHTRGWCEGLNSSSTGTPQVLSSTQHSPAPHLVPHVHQHHTYFKHNR